MVGYGNAIVSPDEITKAEFEKARREYTALIQVISETKASSYTSSYPCHLFFSAISFRCLISCRLNLYIKPLTNLYSHHKIQNRPKNSGGAGQVALQSDPETARWAIKPQL